MYDIFLGSGTTPIAAERAGRKCYGIEIEPRFVDVTIRRWEQETGRTAILAATGETFEQVHIRRKDDHSTPTTEAGHG